MTPRLILAGTICGVLALAPSPDTAAVTEEAAAGFPAPTVLHRFDTAVESFASSSDVALDRNGNSVAAWVTEGRQAVTHTIHAARSTNGTWGPRQTVFVGEGQVNGSVAVTTGSGGRAAVAWDAGRTIRVAVMDPEGNWTAPTVLTTRGILATEPVVAGPEGSFFVVWTSIRQGIAVARIGPSGEATEVSNLGPGLGPVLSAAGGVVTAWWRQGDPAAVVSRTWSPATGWAERKVVVGSPGRSVKTLHAQRLPNGGAVVGWVTPARVIVVRQDSAGSTYTRVLERRVDPIDAQNLSLRTVRERGGRLMVAWTMGTAADGHRAVHVVALRINGQWSEHRIVAFIPDVRQSSISCSGEGCIPFAADLASQGRVLVTWLADMDLVSESGRVMLQERATGSWSAPVILQRRGLAARLALNTQGHATLLWCRTDPSQPLERERTALLGTNRS